MASILQAGPLASQPKEIKEIRRDQSQNTQVLLAGAAEEKMIIGLMESGLITAGSSSYVRKLQQKAAPSKPIHLVSVPVSQAHSGFKTEPIKH